MKLKTYYNAFNRTELKTELQKLYNGCGEKVDYLGYCWHITNYERKYCNKCKRRINIIQELLGDEK
jgi:hypothetical protein